MFVHGGTPSWVVLLYLIAIQLMFQLGWATVQIGHLALIPQLTSTEPQQVELNSIRQCFTYFASIIVFLLAGVIIKTKEDGTNQLTWDDCWSMQTLCYIISAIGTLTTVFFHICTPERATQTNMLESTMIATVRENYLSVSKWFKRPGFYRTCALYTLTRMIYNLTQCYIPVYVSESMNYPTKYVGYVPLVLYIAGCVYSALVTPLVNCLGKKVVYTFTGCLVIGSSIWFEFIYTADDQIWGLAVLLGAGSAGVLILSLAVIADLIGEYTASSAFIYGAFSVTDKLLNGAAIAIIQVISPCSDTASAQECHDDFGPFFGRMMIVFTVISMILTLSLPNFGDYEPETKEEDSCDEGRRLLGDR